MPHPTLPPPLAPRRISHDTLILHTRRLAAAAGRKPPHITQADYEQARRELTGETEPSRQDLLIQP